MQKLRCPKCSRILGGKATTKKNNVSYYYYYCNDRGITIRENQIEDTINNIMEELFLYDMVVNQSLLPMIKTKLNNPKDKLIKELNIQNTKFERIKKAYVSGTFTLKEYNEERKIVEDTIKDLEVKIKECDIAEELQFTPEDILVKRDIDYINKLVYPTIYKEKIKSWRYLTRDEQADYLMKWIEDILLIYDDKKIKVKKINFRNSFFDDLCNLLANGYLDINRTYVNEKNEKVKMRYSEYLPGNTITENLLRLREFYNVGYYESIYNYDNKTMEFEYVDVRQIVRCFPVDEEKSKIGFLYIDKNEITKLTKPEEVFEYIPRKEKENHYVMKSITIKR